MALSDRDREILDFEGSWWTRPRPKAAAIRAHLGMSPAPYYRRLAVLAESADARDYAPMVVHRLRRAQKARRRERFEGLAQPTPRRR